MQQKVRPRAHGCRIDVLVATEAREAVGEGNDHRWHPLLADQPVKPFGQVLAETHPIRMGEPATCEAGEVHQQRQVSAAVSCRRIDIDCPRSRIAKQIPIE